MTFSLHGVGVASGVASGRIRVLERDRLEVPQYEIATAQFEREARRFRKALETAQQQLRAVKGQVPLVAAAEVAAFLDTHLLMLEDPALVQEPLRIMRERQRNAEWALKTQRDTLAAVFEGMDNPYLQARSHDLDHVVDRLMRILLRQAPSMHEEPDSRLKGYIVLADDLTPADTALIRQHGIAGFITEAGGPTSHTAILARSLGIPSIVGVPSARRFLREDDEVVLDGRNGVVVVDPDARTLTYYREQRAAEARHFSELIQLKESPATTRDDATIRLEANIELPVEFEQAMEFGADGVGLLRTEFVFLNRNDLPTEEDHFHEYAGAVEAMQGRPITIRTLDLGADKQWRPDRGPSTPVNPALGLRAVRLCLRDKGLFRAQLRAIVRVSEIGPVRLLIPMVSSIQELRDVIALVTDIRDELRAQGVGYDPDMPIGTMIEVPAAAVCADLFARQSDFLSIGTNDLIQYTMAIDRVNDEVNYLYDPLHPAVLRLVYGVVEAGRRYGKPVSLCGEMASDPHFVRLLLALGLRALSVHPSMLLEVKSVIRETSLADLPDLNQDLLNAMTSAEASALLDALNRPA